MKTKKHDLFKNIAMFLGVVLLCGLTMVFALWQKDRSYRNFISLMADEQMSFTKEIAPSFKEVSNKEEAMKIAQKLVRNQAKTLFVYGEDEVIFERNDVTTEKIHGFSFSELHNYYTENGGKGMNDFFTLLLEKKDFSAVLVKENSHGKELVTINFIDTNYGKVAVGVSISEPYLLSVGKITEYQNYQLLLIIFLLCVLIVITGQFALSNYRYKNKLTTLKMQQKENQQLIQEQSKILYENMDKESERTFDITTGLYSRNFALTFMEKLMKKPDIMITEIIATVTNLNQINLKQGYEHGNLVLLKLAKLIKNNIGEKDIAARIGGGVFLIIKTGLNKEESQFQFDQIKSELTDNLDAELSFTYTLMKGDNDELSL